MKGIFFVLRKSVAVLQAIEWENVYKMLQLV